MHYWSNMFINSHTPGFMLEGKSYGLKFYGFYLVVTSPLKCF